MPRKVSLRSRNSKDTSADADSDDESNDLFDDISSPEENSDEEYVPASESKKKKSKPTKSKKKTSKKTTQRKQKTAKRKKAVKTAIPSTGRSKKKKKGGRTTTSESESEAARTDEEEGVVDYDPNSICAAVRQQSTALSITVDEWIQRYEEDKMKAVAGLVSFVIQASGCPTEVDTENINNDFADHVVNLVEKFPEDPGPYPIVSRKKSYKHFSNNFLEFWDTLVEKCKDSFLLDDTLFPHLLTCLSILANSQVRAFRHTSTLALYQIVNSCIGVAIQQRKEMDRVEKMRKKEKKKKKKNQPETQRLNHLEKQVEEFSDKILKLEDIMKNVFEGVFVNRTKDVVEEIKSLSVLSLGRWIKEYWHFFLEDKRLKYLGLLLYDKAASVRESAIRALKEIYSVKQFQGRLKAFTNRFGPRLLQMIDDVNISTAVETIKLLNVMLGYGLLKKKQIKSVIALVVDENASIRHAAAAFAYKHMCSEKKGTKKKKKELLDLNDVLDFALSFSDKVQVVGEYVVDVLWNLCDCVKDYNSMVEMLLGDEELDPQDQLNLVKMLNACVKMTAGSLKTSTTNFDTGKVPKPKRRSKEQQEEVIEQMSSSLAQEIPQLLAKYGAEYEIVRELIEIPLYFDLDVYSTHRLQHNHDELLKQIRDIFWKHTDHSVFIACGKVYKYFTKEKHSLKSESRTAFDELCREISNRLEQCLHGSIDERTEEGEAEKHRFSLLVILERIKQLTSVVDVPYLNTDVLHQLLKDKVNTEDVEDEVAMLTLEILYFNVLWRAAEVNEQEEKEQNDVDNMKKERDFLVEQSMALLDEEQSIEVQQKAYKTVCDICVVFSSNSKDSVFQMQLTEQQQDKLMNAFDNFMSSLMSSNMTGESEETLQDTLLEEQLLAAGVGKLISYGVVPRDKAPHMLAHYVRHGRHISDVVKAMFHKLKTANPQEEWKVEIEAIQLVFSRYLKEKEELEQQRHSGSVNTQETENRVRDVLNEFLNISKRLSMTHMSTKHPENIAKVVREGINYAFEDPSKRIEFLDGMTFYISRLESDAASSLTTALDEASSNVDLDDESSQAVSQFMEQLRRVSKGEKPSTPATAKNKSKQQQRRRLKRSKKSYRNKKHGSDDDSGSNSSSDDDDEKEEEYRKQRRAQRRLELKILSQDQSEGERTSEDNKDKGDNDDDDDDDDDETQLTQDSPSLLGRKRKANEMSDDEDNDGSPARKKSRPSPSHSPSSGSDQ